MSEARAFEPNVTRVRTVTVIPPRMKLMQGIITAFNRTAQEVPADAVKSP